jgi:ABC-type uncharacterized transport system ATPase component
VLFEKSIKSTNLEISDKLKIQIENNQEGNLDSKQRANRLKSVFQVISHLTLKDLRLNPNKIVMQSSGLRSYHLRET